MRLIDADSLIENMCYACSQDACDGLGKDSTAKCYSIQLIEAEPTYTPSTKQHCDECMHLINRRYGRGGALFGKCELKTWRETRYGRNVACKKFKQQDECADFI